LIDGLLNTHIIIAGWCKRGFKLYWLGLFKQGLLHGRKLMQKFQWSISQQVKNQISPQIIISQACGMVGG